jgi:hypothetical protein
VPPQPFFARALCDLSHAAWRDAPLPSGDARVTLPPAAARAVPTLRLRRSWEWLVAAYFDASPGRHPDALAALRAALAALALEAPGAQRTLRAASLHESVGRAQAASGQLGDAYDSTSLALSFAFVVLGHIV